MKISQDSMQNLFESFSPYIEDSLSIQTGDKKWHVSGWAKRTGDIWRGYATCENRRYELNVSETYITGAFHLEEVESLTKSITDQIDAIAKGNAHCEIVSVA